MVINRCIDQPALCAEQREVAVMEKKEFSLSSSVEILSISKVLETKVETKITTVYSSNCSMLKPF